MRFGSHRIHKIFFAIVLTVTGADVAVGADVTATSLGTGLWSDATNWSSDPDIPNNTATTYDVVISSGTITADVPNVTINGLTLDGGLLNGTENITVTTSGTWSEQRLFGSVGIVVDTGATFDITGNDSSKELEDTAALTVRGTVNLSGSGGVRTSGSAATDVSIDVEASGMFDIQGNANLTGEFGGSLLRKGTLTNAGTVRKSAGTGTSRVDGNWDVENTGSVIVQSGTLEFGNFNFGNTFNNNGSATAEAGTLQFGNGTSTGTFDVQAGANLRTTSTISGQHVFDSAQIANAGTLTLDGNTQFTNAATYTGAGNVTIAGGNLTSDVALTFPDLNWTGGTISSTAGIVVPAAGVAIVSGSSTKQFRDANLLTIEGTANVTSSNSIQTDAAAAQPATINVAATGILDFQGDAGLAASVNIDPRGGALTVDGTLRKSAGTQTSTVTKEWSVINNGVVDTQTGTLAFEGAVSGSGSYTGTGTVAFEGGFFPGDSPAKIDFAGDVQFGTDATLAIEIGGTTPGSEYDLLDIEDTSTLAGELDVSLIDSFEPVLGNSFEIINAATSLTGTFSTATLPALTDAQLGWDVIYDTNTLTLEIVSLATDLADADFNEDTFVDDSDLSTWQTNYGAAGTSDRSTGDTDIDMDTDGIDFLTWQRQYTGSTPASPASPAGFAVVPEPSSVLLAFIGMTFSALHACCRPHSQQRQAQVQ